MRVIIFILFLINAGKEANSKILKDMGLERLGGALLTTPWYARLRRQPQPPHRIIDPNEDCFLVTSEEGKIFYKSPSDEPLICGIFMIAEPNKRIEVTFNYLDVPCDAGGLVAWVDGWELNGQVWPADSWDDGRVVESCDRHPRRKLVSRQNAALIQYRVPAKEKGFVITIRHLRKSKPCNVMLFGADGVYTLRNYGLASNCSIIAVAPTAVRVLDLNVGQTVKMSSSLELETGTIFNCLKRELEDYVEIGGSSGLDHTKMEVLYNICGVDSSGDRRQQTIACEVTVVKLVSSGRYYNSVTVAFSSLEPEDVPFADLMCHLNVIT